MTRKAGIYARISQDRIGAGLGVERQVDDCRELAGRLGWQVVDVYTDNDVSAYSGKPRPGYERLMRDIEDGHITAVIAWHADRLHRSPTELERYIAACDPAGVPTQTVRAGLLDLSTANGRMVARITGAVARNESEQKSERLRRQRQQLLASGRWHGGRRPFGYLDDGHTPHDREAEALADAARGVLAGESVRSIAKAWNAAGLTTTTGQPWTSTRIRTTLLRPRNAGYTGGLDDQRQPQVIGDAQWPAVIEPDQWRALVDLLADPRRRTHSGTSRKLLGSFLYLCECGERLTSGGYGSRGQSRYACPAGHMRRGSDPIDDLVRRVVVELLNRERLDLLPPAPDVTTERDKLAALRVRADELAREWVTLGMTASQFRAANETLAREIADLERTVSRAAAGGVLAGIADQPDPGAAFLAADIDRQRAIVGALCRVTVHRVGPGRLPGGRNFDPASVTVEPIDQTAP